MCRKFTEDELNTMNHAAKNDVIYQMQDRLDKLEHDYENLIEQVRLANQQRFGRSTESLKEMAGCRAANTYSQRPRSRVKIKYPLNKHISESVL